jgi:uncharacterized membrane protein
MGVPLNWFAENSTIAREALGASAILLGVVVSSIAYLMRLGQAPSIENYRRLRADLGRGILIGLELLIAADILRSLVISPTLESIAVLVGIVFVRTFLSFSLQVEFDGHWPWSRTALSQTQPEQDETQ